MKYILAFSFLIMTASYLIVTASSSAPNSYNCDWRDRAAFIECIQTSYADGPLVTLQEFLIGDGFIRAEQAAGEDFLYYQKSSNNLSGYRIAVIVWVNPDQSIDRIEIR